MKGEGEVDVGEVSAGRCCRLVSRLEARHE
jgi:hypothetical protein